MSTVQRNNGPSHEGIRPDLRTEAELPLEGGNFDMTAVRVGDTVRRSAGPWTPAVHAVLDHLSARNFAGAPLALGIDGQGREVLSFMEGEAGRYPLTPYMLSDDILMEAARLLRAMHDATASFTPPRDAVWRQAVPDPGPIEVVCHNDWAPYNAIFRDTHLAGFIDWDFARPGSRLWDVAWMAHTWVPLRDDSECVGQGWSAPPNRSARLRLLCDAYGLADRRMLIPAIRARIAGTAAWIEAGAASGASVFVRLSREGHAAGYRHAVGFVDAVQAELEAALQ